MSDGSDNPILDMGLMGMMSPNPYLNPAYANKPLALPGFYTGSAGNQPPTDAQGKPIQSFVDANNAAQNDYQKQLAAFNSGQPAQGTTLNSTPAGSQPAGGTINYNAMGSAGAPLQELMNNFQTAQSKLTPQQQYDQQQSALYRQQALGQMNATAAGKAGSGFGTSQGGAFNPGQATDPVSLAMMSGSGGGSAPAAAGPAPPSPPDMRQAYLDALANPGKVTTPGATVPQSPPLGVPSVMASFLSAHPSGGSKGAGSYDNSGFFNTLNKLGTA